MKQKTEQEKFYGSLNSFGSFIMSVFVFLGGWVIISIIFYFIFGIDEPFTTSFFITAIIFVGFWIWEKRR